jgi:hypothetical protein
MTLKDSPAWIALTQGTIEARSRLNTPPLRTEPVTREHAAALLTAAVQRDIAAGAQVEHVGDATVVLTYGRRPNHVLHLLLTLLTFGLWAVVWAVLAFGGLSSARPSRVMLTVDPHGNITKTPMTAIR